MRKLAPGEMPVFIIAPPSTLNPDKDSVVLIADGRFYVTVLQLYGKLCEIATNIESGQAPKPNSMLGTLETIKSFVEHAPTTEKLKDLNLHPHSQSPDNPDSDDHDPFTTSKGDLN